MSAVRTFYREAGGDIAVEFDETRHSQEGFAAFLGKRPASWIPQ